jgi:hypothetical protein
MALGGNGLLRSVDFEHNRLICRLICLVTNRGVYHFRSVLLDPSVSAVNMSKDVIFRFHSLNRFEQVATSDC